MAIPEDCTNDGAAFVTGCDHYTTGVSQAQLVPSLRGWNCVQDLYMPLRDTCRPVVPSAPLALVPDQLLQRGQDPTIAQRPAF